MINEVVHRNTDIDNKRIYPASKILQYKAGRGSVDKKRVEDAQRVINNVSFEPIAMDMLDELKALLDIHKGEKVESRDLLDELASPVMQLKSSAAMFGYPVITKLTNIMFSFLSHISSMEQEAFEIIEGHHKTLVGIVQNKIKDESHEYAVIFEQELKAACERYMLKHDAMKPVLS